MVRTNVDLMNMFHKEKLCFTKTSGRRLLEGLFTGPISQNLSKSREPGRDERLRVVIHKGTENNGCRGKCPGLWSWGWRCNGRKRHAELFAPNYVKSRAGHWSHRWGR